MSAHNKRKIINDPVFGFINVPNDFLYDIIQHPIFQRLQRIKQLGLASFVYPGAQHTRFQHSLGAMYLTHEAIKQLRQNGQEITPEEADGVLVAILLHDIGHGPFSHLFEEALKVTGNKNHETIGAEIICKTELNDILSGFGYSAKTISEISFGNSKVKFKNEIISPNSKTHGEIFESL